MTEAGSGPDWPGAGAGDAVSFLERRPADAKPSGVTPGEDGTISEDDIRAILPQIVVIRLDLD